MIPSWNTKLTIMSNKQYSGKEIWRALSISLPLLPEILVTMYQATGAFNPSYFTIHLLGDYTCNPSF